MRLPLSSKKYRQKRMYAVLYSLEIDQRICTAPAVFCGALPAPETVASRRSVPLPTSDVPGTADENGGFGRLMGKPCEVIRFHGRTPEIKDRDFVAWTCAEGTLLNSLSGMSARMHDVSSRGSRPRPAAGCEAWRFAVGGDGIASSSGQEELVKDLTSQSFPDRAIKFLGMVDGKPSLRKA